MKIIVLEGVNSSGKSSIGALMVESIVAAGQSCVLVDPAGFGQFGRLLRGQIVHPDFRANADLDAVLFTALRAEGAQALKEAYEAEIGTTLVLERWALALSAYGAADRARPELILELRRLLQSVLRVDLTVLLNISGDLAFQRMREIGSHNRFELRGEEYLEDVAQSYRHFAQCDERTEIVDGADDLKSTFRQVRSILVRHGWQLDQLISSP